MNVRFFAAIKIMLEKVKFSHRARQILHVSKSSQTQIGGVETVLGKYTEISKNVFDEVEIITIEDRFGFFWTCKVVDGVRSVNCFYQFKVSGHYFSFSFLVLLLI